jgi:hypothetical protein
LDEYDQGKELILHPLGSLPDLGLELARLNFRVRQVHAGSPLVVGFNEAGYWVRARLRGQDRLCDLLLKSLLVYDKKFIEK